MSAWLLVLAAIAGAIFVGVPLGVFIACMFTVGRDEP